MLLSGSFRVHIDRAREIWLVDPAPKVIEKFQKAVDQLQTFMQSKGLACEPSQVVNLRGDIAKAEFINHFKEVQSSRPIGAIHRPRRPEQTEHRANTARDALRGFKAMYLDTALDLKRKQGKGDETETTVQQLEFDLVVFSSAHRL